MSGSPGAEGALPLEPDRAQMEAAGIAALARAVAFIEGLDSAPGQSPATPELLRALAAPPPEQGRPFPEVLDQAMAALRPGFETAGPGYLAYIPGGGLYLSALADLLVAASNRYGGFADAAPGLVTLDHSVLGWLAGVFGYPEGWGGDLTSGGSISILSAVVTARDARLDGRLHDGTLYVSDQAHHAIAKAARIAGIPEANVRVVPTAGDLRLDPQRLDDAIRADQSAGRRPFLIVASAGTTNAGVVDPLGSLADVCAGHGIWLHVDGAYGGMFALTDRGRARLAGIDRGDSLTVDPHKGLFLPYGTGALLVRDGTALRASFAMRGAYLHGFDVEGGLPNPADHGPELTRHARALRVWLPLHAHGVAAFRAALDEKLDLARAAYDALREIPTVEVPWEPELSVVCFRHRAGDQATQALLDDVNGAGPVYLSSTQIGGRTYIRICVLSFRTHADRVTAAVDLVRAAARGH